LRTARKGFEMAERIAARDHDVPLLVRIRHIERYLTGIRWIGNVPDGVWLDYGCGDGTGIEVTSMLGVLSAGYDPKSPGGIGTNKWRSIARDTYAVAMMIEVIEHMTDEQAAKALQRIMRVLMDDGRLLITTPVRKRICRKPDNPYHKVEYSERAMYKLLRDNGYDVTVCLTLPATFYVDGEYQQGEQGYFVARKA